MAKQPCLVCGHQPADAHHLRFAQSRVLGRRVSDEFTVPLCRGDHREVHRCGDEVAGWRKVGVDPTVAARSLLLETHPMATGPYDLSADVEVSPGADAREQAKANSGRHAGGHRTRSPAKSVEGATPCGAAPRADS
jgi:hypothetical protein